MNMNQIASDLYNAITEADAKKPKPYDTKAEVLRVEGETVWVKIPGGIDETPVARTNNANDGDQVMVRISGGRAWLLGNQTNPATDDRVAIQAGETAGAAFERAANAALAADEASNQALRAYAYADDAMDAASTAATAAGNAQTSANNAATAAGNAQTSADNAATAAGNAQTSANHALTSATQAYLGLSEVQDVIGTLNWIAQHGYYSACTETTVVANKVYYTLNTTAIVDPQGNPSTSGYYEYINGKYVLSSDTTVDVQKTYYTVESLIVTNPTGSPAGNNYYELVLDSGVAQYIATHLAYTVSGLRLFNDNSSGFLELSTGGIKVYNADRTVMGEYGVVTRVGSQEAYHILIDSDPDSPTRGMSFWSGVETNPENRTAYIEGKYMTIPYTVVINAMDVGSLSGNRWRWEHNENTHHLTLKWVDGGI